MIWMSLRYSSLLGSLISLIIRENSWTNLASRMNCRAFCSRSGLVRIMSTCHSFELVDLVMPVERHDGIDKLEQVDEELGQFVPSLYIFSEIVTCLLKQKIDLVEHWSVVYNDKRISLSEVEECISFNNYDKNFIIVRVTNMNQIRLMEIRFYVMLKLMWLIYILNKTKDQKTFNKWTKKWISFTYLYNSPFYDD